MGKRYIEEVLPLEELNKYAQKGGGVNSINVMHPYFARRPLTASRAMTIASLVNVPKNERDRKTLEKQLIQISKEEWPNEPKILNELRERIYNTHTGKAPKVLDPFAGGGSMPLEALRLGCDATALDLNPIAYIALLGTVVYPQKYKNWISESRIQNNEIKNTKEELLLRANEIDKGMAKTPSLISDIQYWADWVLSQAEMEIGDVYPKDPDGKTPVAYIWAKTIICPHCGGEIPLIKRRWLQKSKGKELIAYRIITDNDQKEFTVEIIRGETAKKDKPNKGTMHGATAECIFCDMPIERDQIAEQGSKGEMDHRLLVVVLDQEGIPGKFFRSALDSDKENYISAKTRLLKAEEEGINFWGENRLLSVIPDEPTPPKRARSVSIRLYGIDKWGKIFNDRQLLSLITIGRQIREVRNYFSAKEKEYAKVITLYLSIILCRLLTRHSTVPTWQSAYTKISSLFSRHDIQMTWDYAEANPFSGKAASWDSQLNSLLGSLKNIIESEGEPANVVLGSATELPNNWREVFDAVICDPPYYDSVTYADLSDYFYPWHKRIIGDYFPEAFVTEVTPKGEELIQEAIYHGGSKNAAKDFYENGMSRAFNEMYKVLRDDGIAVIMFAHKKSSAWETLVGAIISSGFQVTASWPLNTEGRRLQSYRAVTLASSVYLVCRKRPIEAPSTGYLEDIESELRQVIRRYLEQFWAAGIGGADFFMSAIGPGLSVYSRYEKVERYNGSIVTVGDFLNLVRHEVATFAVERIIGSSGFSEKLDQATQFYLLWRWGYNDWEVPDGEALLLSTAVGIELNVLMNRFGLIKKSGSKLKLLGPSARASSLASVTDRVVAGGAVPLIDIIHKMCLLWEADQSDKISAIIAARGGEIWPVAQAIAELLPKDNQERKVLLSMLGIRIDIDSRAQSWAAKNQNKIRQPEQLELWQKDEDSVD